jgi:hypothetical protein
MRIWRLIRCGSRAKGSAVERKYAEQYVKIDLKNEICGSLTEA